MTWDKTLPAGTNRLRDSDDYIRENQDCLDDAIDREHTFPGTKGSTAGQHTPGACGVLKVDTTANLGTGTGVAGAISYDTTTSLIMRDTGSALSAISAVAFPSGTKMFFYQNTAPTGWTIDASVADKVLAVKGGSAAYNVAGGNTAGTWTQPNHTHGNGSLAGPSHTHTGPSHTHTGSSHSHSTTIPSSGWSANATIYSGYLCVGRGTYTWGEIGHISNRAIGSSTGGTGATGAGGTGATGTGGTGAVTGTTAAGATAASFRPTAVIGIVCEKD